MDEEIERLIVSVRADTRGFRSDVEEMRRSLSDGLGGAAEIAGRRIETTLLRAIRSGKLGFEDLKRTALAILADIANSAVGGGLDSLLGGRRQSGLLAIVQGLVGALLGLPGRATGGPVAPGRAYAVGESGPELFVPTASGRIETGARAAPRDLRVTINLNAPQAREPEALARSGRQVARAVRGALEKLD